MNNTLNGAEMAKLIADCDDIVISAHTGPDGDAVGSVSALLLALKKRGKNVRAVLEGLPQKYSIIDGAGLIEFSLEQNTDIKTFIALDCADKARLGKFEIYYDAAPVRINIDHHASNNLFGTHNYVDENASAASELIYNVLTSAGLFELDKSVASALYAGILYDTGGFRHKSTTSHTYYAASKLLEYGIDFSGIYNSIFHTMKFEEAKILSTALANLRREFDNRFVWTSITSAELSAAGAKSSDLDEVVDYCRSVEGSEIALFIYQRDKDEFKISLRSVPEYDISKIALKFGGGGHKNAAGALLYGSIEQCADAVIAEIKKMLCGD